MSLKDLKSRSDRALATMGSAPSSTVPIRPTTTPSAAAFMQPTIDHLNERAKSAEAEAADLRAKLAATYPTEIALELLEEVPGRRRKLTPEQYQELKENLRNNPLIQAVAVKALANGRFEIVSGNNRSAIYGELGRKAVPIRVVEIDEAVVERVAFFANLLQPSLPDFEKYLGFRRERDKSGASQKELAKTAGIPESTVSLLFAFEALPDRARELIENHPGALGMNAAAELAKIAKDGKGDQVVAAVELLVAGRVSQKEAIEHAARTPGKVRFASAPTQAVKVKAGRAEFCQYVSRGTTLRIEFKAADARSAAESRIARLLQEIADEAKKSGN